jgi:hypothetical protein
MPSVVSALERLPRKNEPLREHPAFSPLKGDTPLGYGAAQRPTGSASAT